MLKLQKDCLLLPLLLVAALTAAHAQSMEPDTVWTRVLGGSGPEVPGFTLLNTDETALAKSVIAPDGSIYVATTTASPDGDVTGLKWFFLQDTGVVNTDTTITTVRHDTLVQVLPGDTNPSKNLLLDTLRDSTTTHDSIRQNFENNDRTIDTLRTTTLIESIFRQDSILTQNLGDSTRWTTFRRDTVRTTTSVEDSLILEDSIPSLDIWLVKLNPQGDTLWTKTYGGTNNDRLMDLQLRLDGGLVMVGHTVSDDDIFNQEFKGNLPPQDRNGRNDAFILELDTAGQFERIKRFGGSTFDYFFRVLPMDDGSYIILGQTASIDGDLINTPVPDPSGSSNAWIMRLNSNLIMEWQDLAIGEEHFAGSDNITGDWFFSFWDAAIGKNTSGEDILQVMGHATFFFGGGTEDILIAEYTLDGQQRFSTEVGSNTTDYGAALLPRGPGFFSLLGTAGNQSEDVQGSFAGGTSDIWLADFFGTQVANYSRTYGQNNVDVPFGMIHDADSNYLIFGFQRYETDTNNLKNLDFLLKAVNPENGEELYTKKFGGSGNEYLTDVSLSPDGSYLIATGRTATQQGPFAAKNGSSDLWVARMELMPVSLADRSAGNPDFRVFPNPSASGRFWLEAAFRQPQGYRLSNLAGQTVATGRLRSGQNRQELDFTGQPAGLYLLKVGGRAPRKLMIRR